MLSVKRIILALLAICMASCLYSQTYQEKNDCKTKLENIDREIQYLEDLKRGLESRAIKYENQAQRLQFDANQLAEAKRYWNLAEQNRKAVEEIDEKIKQKQEERKNIIDRYHCESYDKKPSKEDNNNQD